MRRRTLFKSDSGSGAFSGNLADAVFYDSNSDSFVTMTSDEITGVIDGYTPIGVVVIPASHDVYGTGECGVMSLAAMNYSTPDTGSVSYQTMYWGAYDINTPLPNYNKFNYIGSHGNLNNGVVQGVNNVAYLPSDQFSTVTGLDGKSNYYFNDSNKYAPSPYNADGSRNEAYYTTAYSTANALSDFDGVGHTRVLTNLLVEENWKTTSAITNSSDAGYYPAACCCWRFHTAGTNQGQWYLPACGEMGYVINRISAINETINKIKSVYTSVVAVAVNDSGGYWSSSEYSAGGACEVYMYEGYVYGSNRSYESYVRAFLRL